MTLGLGTAGSEAESEQKLAGCRPGALRGAGSEAGLPQERFRGRGRHVNWECPT